MWPLSRLVAVKSISILALAGLPFISRRVTTPLLPPPQTDSTARREDPFCVCAALDGEKERNESFQNVFLRSSDGNTLSPQRSLAPPWPHRAEDPPQLSASGRRLPCRGWTRTCRPPPVRTAPAPLIGQPMLTQAPQLRQAAGHPLHPV